MSVLRRFVLGLLIALGSVGAPAAHSAELLVGNKSDDTVWRLSLRDGRRIGEYRTGEAPHEIAVAPDGRLAVVTNYGGAKSGNTLSVLDLVSGKPTRTIDLGQHSAPHGVRFLADGRRVLVTTEATASLVVVDVASGEVERSIDVGGGTGHMLALAPDGQVAYLTKIQAGTISRIDLATGARIEKPAGKGAEGVAVRPDGTEVWVTNREDGTLTVHDPRTLAVKRRMSSKGFPIRVAFSADGALAFVTNARAATLAVFNARTKVPVATVALSREDMAYQPTMLGNAALPIGVVVAADRPRAYVAISGGDRIAVIDTQRWQVIDYWVTGREPDALGFID
ncbi:MULTISPECIES: beta-propeller fold lactonase family protein [unclassified Pseudoxanthomonas]|uniref:beta-propeller fold lactonase family protein n=1 Tax=unclassified Pseudoxanthomonas TaxID=2645906 RepID=UPI0008EBCE8A|nr:MULTISPECIES: beta-propeller fold lactonase family protein [unclassified Pseudoxanthomonas]PPJ42317.1 gluconolaconase [Pseudoxanthomonas sp. KAs_5_3]SFV27777.1 40-residue YVTN family beta-propeller repeat-containing protein [Pseudoxanthomonas sp. YR558]